MSFGSRLRQQRLRHRMTQEDLAEALGISPRTISRWEQDLAVPRSRAQQQLSRLFGLSLEELFDMGGIQQPSSLLWTVPFPRNPCFTGREEILQTLQHQLTSEFPIQLSKASALCGLGGIGKTQVAIEYAYRYAQQYSAIFWLAADTAESLMRSLHHIAEQLQLPERQATVQAQMVMAVQNWLATHPGWLLIADDVEDLNLLQTVLPPIRQGALLLTTRQQALGTLAEPLELPPMSNEEGVALLLRRARQLSTSLDSGAIEQEMWLQTAEAVEAGELVKLLEGLPLALDQAGTYLEETGCSVAEYFSRYQSQRKQMLSRRGIHTGAHPDSVTTTLRLSIQQIERKHPAASDLLRACSFLHAEAIPEELLIAGASQLGVRLSGVVRDAYQFDLAVAALRSVSLVTRAAETRTLSVHRLVQAVLQDQMEEQEVRVWSERVIRLVNAAFPEGEIGNWTECERYLAQVLACVPLIERTPLTGPLLDEAGELLVKAGSYLMIRGRYKEAEPLLSQAAAMVEQHHNPDHSVVFSRLERRAELFWRQGEYGHAEALLLLELRLEEQQLGCDHLQTAETLNGLATVYWSQGKYEQAKQVGQRALNIREQQLGVSHSDTALTLLNLATVYRDQGKDEEAHRLYQRALNIFEQQLGPEHPYTALALNGLATVYRDQRKDEEARRIGQRALDIFEQQLGPDHPYTAYTLKDLARVYHLQGEHEKAAPLYQRALAIYEQRLGSAHPWIAEALNGLARVYHSQGEHEKAAPLYQRALAIYEQRLGSTRPKTMEIRNSYRHLLEQSKKLAGMLSEE